MYESTALPGIAGNGRRVDNLHRGTLLRPDLLSGLRQIFFLLVRGCSNRSNDLSFKVCDQVAVEFLPSHDEWLNISAKLTWATAA